MSLTLFDLLSRPLFTCRGDRSSVDGYNLVGFLHGRLPKIDTRTENCFVIVLSFMLAPSTILIHAGYKNDNST